jgi:hypothetical protein
MLDVSRLLAAVLPGRGRSAGEDAGKAAVAQSLASAGLSGLVGLPFLMLASVMLETPLAGPAAIALGYLGSARALALCRPGRAAAWSAAVFAGLVAWTLLPFATGDGPSSAPELSAVLLAPLFAAAPAFARFILATTETSDATEREEAMFAATADAAKPAGGTASAPEATATAAAPPEESATPEPLPAQVCSLEAELDFALRTLAGRMRGRRVRLDTDVEPGLAAQCDRRACRRMLAVLIGCALGRIRAGDGLRLEARSVRGVALIRVAMTTEEPPEAIWRAEHMAAVEALVEQAGGTALREGVPGEARVSVRLALAPPEMAVRPKPVREAA